MHDKRTVNEKRVGLLDCRSVGRHGLDAQVFQIRNCVLTYVIILYRAYYFDILVIRTRFSNAKMIRILPEIFVEYLFIFFNHLKRLF